MSDMSIPMLHAERVSEADYAARFAGSLSQNFRNAAPRRAGDGGDAEMTRLLMRDGKKLVGMATLYETPDAVSLGDLEVPAARRGKGYGPVLFEEVFRHAAETGRAVSISPYTSAGKQYLRPHEEEFAARHGVALKHERWA